MDQNTHLDRTWKQGQGTSSNILQDLVSKCTFDMRTRNSNLKHMLFQAEIRNTTSNTGPPITVENGFVEFTKNFQYLGSIITVDLETLSMLT